MTSLPSSSEPPMIAIAIGLAVKIDIKPTIEKYAATADIPIAVKNRRSVNIIVSTTILCQSVLESFLFCLANRYILYQDSS